MINVNNWRMSLARRLARTYIDKNNTKNISRSPISHISHISLNVYKADGGFVLEYQKVDNMIGETNQPCLHLITDDQDLGERIGHIITLEMLRS